MNLMPICDDDRNLLSVVAKACYAERQLSKPDREISWPVVRFLLLDVMRKNHGGGTGHRNIFFVTAQWHHPAFCFQSLIMTGVGLGTVFMIRRDERVCLSPSYAGAFILSKGAELCCMWIYIYDSHTAVERWTTEKFMKNLFLLNSIEIKLFVKFYSYLRSWLFIFPVKFDW